MVGKSNDAEDSVYHFKIDEMIVGDNRLSVEPSQITVLIGSNNVGKSRLLKEIRSRVLGGPNEVGTNAPLQPIMLNGISFSLPDSYDELEESYGLSKRVKRGRDGNYRIDAFCDTGIYVDKNVISRNDCRTAYFDDWKGGAVDCLFDKPVSESSLKQFLQFAGSMFVSFVGTDTRLLVSAGDQYLGSLDWGSNLLSATYRSDPCLTGLSEHIKRLFSKDAVLEIETMGGVVQPRVSDDFSDYRCASREDAGSNMDDYGPLSDEGDGLRGFVAVYIAALMDNRPIVLIDEPEAFLHPYQARELGKLIRQHCRENSQIVISTHSVHFLSGLLDASPGAPDSEDLSIIHLSRINDITSAEKLEPEDMLKVMASPLLRHSSIMDGLFAPSVTVVESEADELFFRLLFDKTVCGAETLFINVHSKDRIRDAVDFYQRANVACYAITDFDILNDWRKLQKLLQLFEVSEDEFRELPRQIKEEYQRRLDSEGETPEKETLRGCYKKETHKGLSDQTIDQIKRLRKESLSKRMLIIGSGELETTLEPLKPYSTNKSSWIEDALDEICNGENDLSQLQIVSDLKSLYGKPGF